MDRLKLFIYFCYAFFLFVAYFIPSFRSRMLVALRLLALDLVLFSICSWQCNALYIQNKARTCLRYTLAVLTYAGQKNLYNDQSIVRSSRVHAMLHKMSPYIQVIKFAHIHRPNIIKFYEIETFVA